MSNFRACSGRSTAACDAERCPMTTGFPARAISALIDTNSRSLFPLQVPLPLHPSLHDPILALSFHCQHSWSVLWAPVRSTKNVDSHLISTVSDSALILSSSSRNNRQCTRPRPHCPTPRSRVQSFTSTSRRADASTAISSFALTMWFTTHQRTGVSFALFRCGRQLQ